MIVVGLTGSIGMGKSTAAKMLRRLGLPVHEADHAVHGLLGSRGAAVKAVAAAFPAALKGDRIDRRILGDLVFADTDALRRLEAVLHPMVRRSTRAFLMKAARARRPVAVLDIPLLYERGGEGRVDAVIVVSAPPQVQRWRVLGRAGMTDEKLRAILARQVPDSEKRRRADFIVKTGGSRGETLRQLRSILRTIKSRKRPRRHGPSRPTPPLIPRRME
jgi:dephospho-CoA kinase